MLGPAPLRGDVHETGVSGPRARVLELLQQEGSVTSARVGAVMGLHQNTARLHLEALVEAGHAVRTTTPHGRRGRPELVYAPSPHRVEPDVRVREYAGLSTALAAHIARTSQDPTRDAREAGMAWGQSLVGEVAGMAGTPRERILTLLTELGFHPLADEPIEAVRLRRCPLLDTALAHPEVVCSAHLGMVQGLLQALDDDDVVTLAPFSEPGACVLRFARPRVVMPAGPSAAAPLATVE